MYSRRAAVYCAVLAVCGLAGLVAGCEGLPYVLHLAKGQLAVQGQAEPIEDVLASGQLSEQDEAKLRLVVKAREFAVQTIGLSAGRSYTMFYDTEGDPLAWNLSAARRDALVPKTWTFLVVGEVPYLAFFDQEYLREVEGQLIDQGYDTLTYELDAYSTLGLFDDPVRSTMLKRSTLSLVETIIHELLHNTIWRPNATAFNESLATFVGRQGTVEFLTAEFGPDSGWPQVAVAFYADSDVVNTFLMGLYDELEAFYAQPISSREKVAGREAVYQAGRDRFVADVQPNLYFPTLFDYLADLPTNNAWMLSNYRYNLDLEVLAGIYAATGQNWAATLDVFRAAASDPGDPFTYLRDWLAEHSAE
jgi:predicted aminopeptidase